jgi:hypothetical protein
MVIGADGLPADIDPLSATSGSGLAPAADPVLPEFSLHAANDNAAIAVSKNLFVCIRFMFFTKYPVLLLHFSWP